MDSKLNNATCLVDLDDLALMGNTDTSQGDNLFVSLYECQNKTHCRSKAEIDEFVQNHRMFFMFNQQSYNPEGYGPESITSEVNSRYVSL